MAERVRAQRRGAQALARRGDVRPAAGGLPPGRDVRGDAGDRPRGVRRARRGTASSSTGTTCAGRRGGSTCSRATGAAALPAHRARWRRRAPGRRGSRPAQVMAMALHRVRREARRRRRRPRAAMLADLRGGIETLPRHLAERARVRARGPARRARQGAARASGRRARVARERPAHRGAVAMRTASGSWR